MASSGPKPEQTNETTAHDGDDSDSATAVAEDEEGGTVPPAPVGAVATFAVHSDPTCLVKLPTGVSYGKCSNPPTCMSPGARRIPASELPWYLDQSTDYTPPMTRCQEHADVGNDDSICCKCGLKTNPCDPDGNYVRWAADYQIHRNCNHPGPRIFDKMMGRCIGEEGCPRTPYSGTGELCLWHFVRSPLGRVEEDIPDRPVSPVHDAQNEAFDLRESVGHS